MPHAHESQFSDWAEPFPGANYLRQTLAVAEADVRKLIHDPVELLTRMVQPVLWLLIFGQVFNRTRAIPTGGISYLDFIDLGAGPGNRPEVSGKSRATEHVGTG